MLHVGSQAKLGFTGSFEDFVAEQRAPESG